MSQSFQNAEELHTYLINNPFNKNQILAIIPDELKKDYKRLQSKLRQQKYRESHKDVANERSRIIMAQNRSENPEKYKKMNSQHNKEYKQKIKKTKPYVHLAHLQRSYIRNCLNSSTQDKNLHSIKYLGCSINQLIDTFDKKIQFFNYHLATHTLMTWDNIHIDHIKPISKFNLDNENALYICCHYTNLQPLLKVDNLSKNNKWTHENEIFWNLNIKGNNDFIQIYM